MLMTLTPDDVLVGIFYFLGDFEHNENRRVTTDREKIHKAFFNLKQKYPTLMNNFTFRDRGEFQESSELDQALSNLDASGLISRFNLTPRFYVIEKLLENNYSSFVKKILINSGINEDDLKKAAGFLGPEIMSEAA